MTEEFYDAVAEAKKKITDQFKPAGEKARRAAAPRWC